MATLRTLERDDIPGVVTLFDRVYPEHRWTSREACESYFREILLDSPWSDLDLPSWIVEDDRRVVGFAGILPRPMLFRGRSIRVAVGAQFMVDPEERRSLTGLKLAKAVLSGPQDLFIADGSNTQARRMWQGIGGSVPLVHNLHWTRPLRPARQLLSALEQMNGYRPLAIAARPLGSAVDAIAARIRPNQFHLNGSDVIECELDAAVMLPHLPEAMRGNLLQPIYDAYTLSWLLQEVARKKLHGSLRARAVLDGKGQLMGWYLYYLLAGGVSELIQLNARDGALDTVLRRLLVDAWTQGAVAVRCRLDPRHLETLSERHCLLRREDPATLVHTKDAELAAAFHQGEAFITRLEGEWWLRFVGG